MLLNSTRTIRVAAWTGLLLITACGEGLEPATACDPLADDCGPARVCRVLEGATTQCLPPLEAEDAVCVPGSCASGQICLWVEGLLGCRELCDLERPNCSDDRRCSYRLDGVEHLGICAPACTFGADCGEAATCAPVGGQGLLCVGTGPAAEGAPCDTTRCGAGLACLAVDGALACRALCTPLDDRLCAGRCVGLIADVETLRYCVPIGG